MQKNAGNETVNWHTKSMDELPKVPTIGLDDHQFAKDDVDTVVELADSCSQVVFEC